MPRDYTRSAGGRSVLRRFEEVNRSEATSLSDAVPPRLKPYESGEGRGAPDPPLFKLPCHFWQCPSDSLTNTVR